jgi:hypothetical protein
LSLGVMAREDAKPYVKRLQLLKWNVFLMEGRRNNV